MGAIFIYLLKANLLIVIFYLAYYFLVQKETFFNSNRWFLLSGLCTSVLIPLFFIKKIVIIETPKLVATNLSSISNTSNPAIDNSINWSAIWLAVYVLISIVLILKIASELFSFFRLIKNKKITVSKPFAMVDVDENINPFSFFKYIVFNSTKYSNSELENILNHEKVHSKEKHSLDVLIAKIYCTIFWFNPFVWLYKKAIIQNLEYIADQKAIQNIEDKKAYQMTLLKVVTDHNCLSITNSFYQSLIKKRIVMLNKNQSKQKNVWKYALVIPALVAFVIFFQVKVIAQEKADNKLSKSENLEINEVIIDKNSTDQNIKMDCERIKKTSDVDLVVSKIKRNKNNEITGIRIAFNDNKGSSSSHEVEGNEPITPFKFSQRRGANGKDEIRFYDDTDTSKYIEKSLVINDDFNSEMAPPTPPIPPRSPMPNMEKMPKPPTPPNFPTPPNVKAPKDPNDKKAWQKFEEKMQKFEESWNTKEIKDYDIAMKAYEKEMENYEPDMTAFEKEMEIFESKMEKFHEEMESYQEKINENSKK